MNRTKPLFLALVKTGGVVGSGFAALFGAVALLSTSRRRLVPETPTEQFFAPILDSFFATVGFSLGILGLVVAGLLVLWKVA